MDRAEVAKVDPVAVDRAAKADRAAIAPAVLLPVHRKADLQAVAGLRDAALQADKADRSRTRRPMTSRSKRSTRTLRAQFVSTPTAYSPLFSSRRDIPTVARHFSAGTITLGFDSPVGTAEFTRRFFQPSLRDFFLIAPNPALKCRATVDSSLRDAEDARFRRT